MSPLAPQAIYTKTAKGVLETRNRTARLSRELNLVFLSVDGRTPVGELLPRSGMSAQQFGQALDTLVADGYIKAVATQPDASPEDTLDLDFTAPQVMARANPDAAQAQPQTAPDNSDQVRQLNARVQALRQERMGAGRAAGETRSDDGGPAGTRPQPEPAFPALHPPAEPDAATPAQAGLIAVPPAGTASERAAPPSESAAAADLPVVDLARAEAPPPPPPEQPLRSALERAMGQVAARTQTPAAPPATPATPAPTPAPATSAQNTTSAIDVDPLTLERLHVDRAAHDTLAADAAARRKAEAAALSSRAAEARRQKQAEAARRAAILQRQERRKRMVTGSGIGLVALLAAALAWLQFNSLDAYIPGAQAALSARLNQPVTIASLRYVILPTPRLVLEGVAIGHGGGVRVKRIDAPVLPPILFSGPRRFEVVDAHGVAIHPAMLGTIPAWASGHGTSALQADRLRLTDVTLDIPQTALGAFNGTVRLERNGALHWAVFNRDKLQLELVPQADGVRVTFDAAAWRLPFGRAVEFEHLSVKGMLRAGETGAGTFTARVAGGSLQGTLNAKWAGPFSLDGEFRLEGAQLQELARALMPEFAAKGTVKASGRYAMRGQTAAAALANLQAEGTFQAVRGELMNLDLLGGIQAPGAAAFRGGRTGFEELSGTLSIAGGRYSYRQLQLASGPLNATASLEVAPAGELSGRLTGVLASKGGLIARQTLTVGGTVKDPQLRR